MAMYDNENTVKKSFGEMTLPEYQIQARWAEFIELKKVIVEIAKRKNAPIRMLDIGIGNARIAAHLSGITEVWELIETYHGTDNAMACVDLSNEVVNEMNIADKVKVFFKDAAELNDWAETYDLIITTWFTAGNFFPDGFSFENYKSDSPRLDLTHNKKFEKIFQQAYALLNSGGEIVIGCCYIDSDATRKKQEALYNHMNMHMITDERDSFTATREGFWSQRFTKEKLISYLHFVEPRNIQTTALDTYDFAMQVRIRKD